MSFLFTSESVSEGHPDKIADQISDAILDYFLAFDPNAKVACETLVTTGQVVLAGEINSNIYLDVQKIARNIINNIGYTKTEYQFTGDSCGVISLLHEQSSDINQGVEKENKLDQGAGDQGIMFGYATNETKSNMPLSLELSNKILLELKKIRTLENQIISYLRPDAKAQVTIEYNQEGIAKRIETIVVSTQHDPFLVDDDIKMNKQIYNDIVKIVMPRVIESLPDSIRILFDKNTRYLINPTGKFVIGGPHGDTGLTGRKIIVDTYGGKGYHGGGAFSGKDTSKVDRSAAYAARHLAKNLVATKAFNEVNIQLSYAIGVAEPTSIFLKTQGNKTGLSDYEIAQRLKELVDLRPASIEKRLKLRNPIFLETAAYGHMGRENKTVKKIFNSQYLPSVEKEVELFTWEKLDLLDEIQQIIS